MLTAIAADTEVGLRVRVACHDPCSGWDACQVPLHTMHARALLAQCTLRVAGEPRAGRLCFASGAASAWSGDSAGGVHSRICDCRRVGGVTTQRRGEHSQSKPLPRARPCLLGLLPTLQPHISLSQLSRPAVLAGREAV